VNGVLTVMMRMSNVLNDKKLFDYFSAILISSSTISILTKKCMMQKLTGRVGHFAQGN
jgi:hypothetical protein